LTPVAGPLWNAPMNFPPIFCLSLPVVPVFGQIMPQKTILGRECSIRRATDSVHTGSTSFRRTSEWFSPSLDSFPPSSEWFWSSSVSGARVLSHAGVRRRGSDVRRNGSGVRQHGSGVRQHGSGVRRNGSGVRRTESYLPGTNPANVGISAHRPRHGAAAGAGDPFPAMPRPAVRAERKQGGGSHGPVV